MTNISWKIHPPVHWEITYSWRKGSANQSREEGGEGREGREGEGREGEGGWGGERGGEGKERENTSVHQKLRFQGTR